MGRFNCSLNQWSSFLTEIALPLFLEENLVYIHNLQFHVTNCFE